MGLSIETVDVQRVNDGGADFHGHRRLAKEN